MHMDLELGTVLVAISRILPAGSRPARLKRGTTLAVNDIYPRSVQAEHRYRHFCALARALEAVGERWGLLIVRDLLEADQRFNSLYRSCAGITPRQLTARLRQLEAAGVVEREQLGRVTWYRLTPVGHDLRPAVEALLLWGVRHARELPAPDEPVRGYHVLNGVRVALDAAKPPVSAPLTWVWRFPGEACLLQFDGETWQLALGDTPDADVVIETTPRDMARFVMSSGSDRSSVAREFRLHGRPERVGEFRAVFGLGAAERRPEAD
jgi:DNA-binding HxlR family transcriptional regulator